MTHDLHPNEKLVLSVAEAMLIELDAAAKNRMHIERIKET
jgi:hypothetical protein